MATPLSDAITDSEASFEITGNLNSGSTKAGLGGAVSVIGDFNGDRIDDILVSAGGLDVGAPGTARTDAGGVYVIYGGSELAADIADNRFDLSAGMSELPGNGFLVTGALSDDILRGTAAGDVNGDGFDDVLLSAPSFVEVSSPLGEAFDHRPGTAYILYGGPTADALISTSTTIDLAGVSTGTAGLTVIHGEPDFVRAGMSITGGDDLNGDGLDDIAIGTFQADGIVYNPDGTIVTLPDLPPIPGLPEIPDPGANLGRVYTIYGQSSMPSDIRLREDIVQGDGSDGYVIRGFNQTDDVGGDIVSVLFGQIGFFESLNMVDLNNDGNAELILGTPFGGRPLETASDTYVPGGVFIVQFDAGTNPGAEADLRDHVYLEGEATGELSLTGLTAAPLGDINNDGFQDLGITAPLLDALGGATPLVNAGGVYLLFGDDDLFSGTAGLPLRGFLAGSSGARLVGEAQGDAAPIALDNLDSDEGEEDGSFYSGLTALGDINGDGIDDFAAGFSNANDGAGSVFVVLGRDGVADPSLTPLSSLSRFGEAASAGMQRFDGNPNDAAGFDLAGGSDLNGDGAPELLVGAPGDLVRSAGDDGAVYVISLGDDAVVSPPSVITGTPGADRLLGTEGNDTIRGLDGPDVINAGAGNDSIEGGETTADRRDTIYAGDGNDFVNAGHGNDLAYGQAGDDILIGGFGADELFGQAGNDTITGSAFSDLVFGGAGDDLVNGGFGFDRINGGDGADKIFHAGVAGHGSDWIQDYDAAEGDVLLYGGAAGATADNFQVNFTHTQSRSGERSGDDDVQEAFVIYKPTGQILWALVDGQGQSEINIQLGADTFDLLA